MVEKNGNVFHSENPFAFPFDTVAAVRRQLAGAVWDGALRDIQRKKSPMSALERSLKVLEHLAAHPQGKALSTLASDLELPLSAAHRLLSELIRCGYVRQDQSHGDYVLTIKLVSLGLGFLSASGIVDIAQPLLDRLAAESGELVRLAVVDGDELIALASPSTGGQHELAVGCHGAIDPLNLMQAGLLCCLHEAHAGNRILG